MLRLQLSLLTAVRPSRTNCSHLGPKDFIAFSTEETNATWFQYQYDDWSVSCGIHNNAKQFMKYTNVVDQWDYLYYLIYIVYPVSCVCVCISLRLHFLWPRTAENRSVALAVELMASMINMWILGKRYSTNQMMLFHNWNTYLCDSLLVWKSRDCLSFPT